MTRRLRIIHCFRSPVGGIFRHVRDLVDAQSRDGHLVGIVCDATTGGIFEAQLFETIRPRLALGLHRVPMQRHVGIGDLAASWRTFRLLNELQPDVLHGHGAKGGFYARVFGTLMRISGRRPARLYAPHGGVLHYDKGTIVGKAFFSMERRLERMCDHILFVSDHERQNYSRKIGAPRVASSLVYNGVRSEEFEPVNLYPDAADFGFIGMMRDLKGPDIFIEALDGARRKTGLPLTGVMIGDGDELPKYRCMVQERGLAEHVAFHPAMPVRHAFALSHVLVVPSRAEAMPYIVLEALAAGKTLLASAVGGIPEILGHSSPALFEPEPEILAELMAEAIASEKFEIAMPTTKMMRSRFSADAMAGSIQAIYDAALPG